MKRTVVSVSNPRYADVAKTAIDCDVVFEETGPDPLPFRATADDPLDHGRALFNALRDGQHGQVAPLGLADARTKARGALAARRWVAEQAGTSIDGLPIATDQTAQNKIVGAAVAAMLDPGYTVNWKTDDGFVTLGAAQVIGIAQAIRAHVQACYDREAVLIAEIAAATTPAAVAAIDLEAGWP
jgi:hypothetical protein